MALQSSGIASSNYDVAIIGAGPVGMVLACLLGEKGLRVLLLERRQCLPDHSQAIGITPPSLKILGLIGLTASFVHHGIPIRDCHVHGQTGYLGCASFRDIPDPHPFVLSLPQQISMRLLAEKLATYPTVELRMGVEVTVLRQDETTVTLEAEDTGGQTVFATAAFVAGCDGCHGRVRELLGIRTHTQQYGCHFAMGDFWDNTQLGEDAHLFFTAAGAVESFPMPEGRRRWIVQTEQRLTEERSDYISRKVRERTGLNLDPARQLNQTSFSPWRLDCAQLHQGRVLLCGDAAHVMSPIGGQGMNTGIADAEFAAAMLHAILQGGQPSAPWLQAYEHCRGIAARAAAKRAARGMGLGTWRGVAASLLRDLIIRSFLFRGPMAAYVGRWFAMISIPYNSLEKSAWAMRQLELMRTPVKTPNQGCS